MGLTRHLVSLVALGALAVPAAALAAAPAPSPFALDPLADGVYFVRPVDRSDPLRTNALVVQLEDGLLVVDSQPTEDVAREMLEAIRRVDPRPVRYLVLSHEHAESSGGAGAFPAQTLVIASRRTRAALEDPTFEFGAEARARSSAWTAPERRRLPGLVLDARARLFDARNDVELMPIPTAHSPGNLLVKLPGPNLVWAGALLFGDRNPYSRDADLIGWIGVLTSVQRMDPALVLPLRGGAVDARQVGLMRQHLAWLMAQVDSLFVDLVDPERMPDRILGSPELREHFDPDASPSFLPALVRHAIEFSIEQRRKHGIE